MPEQRGRSAVDAAHRSILPNVAGVPWWSALLIAFTSTFTGFAIDAGHKELTHVFAGFYIAGCVIAVLVVQQAGLFTAVIQPPLLLFCAVPGAYWQFHGRKIGSLKDLLINCGYPLIERFPLMLGTAGGVLLFGLIRWFIGTPRKRATAVDAPDGAPTSIHTAVKATNSSLFAGVQGALNSLLGLNSRSRGDRAGDPAADAPRNHAGGPTPRPPRSPRSNSSVRGRSRSRHARPPLEDQGQPVSERPRRSARRDDELPRDFRLSEDPPDQLRRPRRRPRPEADSDLRSQAPRESRREPRARRDPYERPTRSRFEPYDRHDPQGAPARARPDGSYEPSQPQRRRPAPNGANGANPTHHPISQVRYRGSAPRDEPGQERQSRSRPPAQSWEHGN